MLAVRFWEFQLLVHCSWDAAKPQLDIVRPADAEDHFEASACRGAKCMHSQKVAEAEVVGSQRANGLIRQIDYE